MVVRRDPVGDPAPGQVAAVRGVRRPPGGREPVAHARGRRPVRVPGPARVQPGHLRPDARVLEATGVGPAHVPGNPSVPAAQEPRLRARRRRVMTVRQRQPARGSPGRVAVRAPAKRVLSARDRCRRLNNGDEPGPNNLRPAAEGWPDARTRPTLS